MVGFLKFTGKVFLAIVLINLLFLILGVVVFGVL